MIWRTSLDALRSAPTAVRGFSVPAGLEMGGSLFSSEDREVELPDDDGGGGIVELEVASMDDMKAQVIQPLAGEMGDVEPGQFSQQQKKKRKEYVSGYGNGNMYVNGLALQTYPTSILCVLAQACEQVSGGSKVMTLRIREG